MKKTILSILVLILFSLVILGCGSSTTSSTPPKPDIQYTIQKVDVPKSDPSAWAPGSKRQVSYTVQVPKGISEDQVKKIGEYLLETDAKPLKNWNVAYLKFITPDNQSTFATAVYTKNAKVPDGNQIKPGQYDGFIWGWSF